MKYLKLIRLPNLLMIIATQCIIKYGFFAHFDVAITLSNLGFIFLTVATACIAAGGYIINDIYDITADKVNKSACRIVGVHIDEKKARLLYYLFTFTGIGLGFVLSAMIMEPWYILYFVGIALGLYSYSRFLKKIPLIGNIIISLIVGASIIIVGAFELLPQIDSVNESNQMISFNILKDIAIFAVIINFLREIVKDIEDIQGDHVARFKTVPIVLGVKRTAQATAILCLIAIVIITMYTFNYLFHEKWAVGVLFFGVIAPLGYVSAQLWEATHKKQFSKLSLILKIIMFIGICAIPLISYTIDHVIKTS